MLACLTPADVLTSKQYLLVEVNCIHVRNTAALVGQHVGDAGLVAVCTPVGSSASRTSNTCTACWCHASLSSGQAACSKCYTQQLRLLLVFMVSALLLIHPRTKGKGTVVSPNALALINFSSCCGCNQGVWCVGVLPLMAA